MKRLVSILVAAGLVVPVSTATDYTPPSNLDELSQAEQLAYFNLVVNRVRNERPGFRQRECLKIIDYSSNKGDLLNAVINVLVRVLMPGDWLQNTLAAGQPNKNVFMSRNANASDLRPHDITSIHCEKQEDNWVIELFVRDEINPALGLDSSIGRIAPVLTPVRLVEEVALQGLKANADDINLIYSNGYVNVNVNEQGQIIAASKGFQVDAQINNASVIGIMFDFTGTQVSEWQYADFDWDIPWWLRLPTWAWVLIGLGGGAAVLGVIGTIIAGIIGMGIAVFAGFVGIVGTLAVIIIALIFLL